MSLRVCVPPSPQAAVVSCLLDRRTINGSLQKQFLVRWVGEAQSDSWHDIDAFIWRPKDLEALSRHGGFARLEDDPWYPVGLHTTEGTIASIIRQKGAAAEEARAAAEARAAEDAALRQRIGAKKKLALQLRATDKPAAIQALREALREAKQLEATLKARLEARAAEEARAAAEAKAAELVAAREAKEKHQLAIVHDAMPMVMERGEVRKEAEEARREARSSQFRGPCKGVCKQCCACCVSADGTTLYGRVPIASSYGNAFVYILPLCLHMCLCPQQGCDPCAGDDDGCGDRLFSGLAQLVCVNPFLCCSQGENDCW